MSHPVAFSWTWRTYGPSSTRQTTRSQIIIPTRSDLKTFTSTLTRTPWASCVSPAISKPMAYLIVSTTQLLKSTRTFAENHTAGQSVIQMPTLIWQMPTNSTPLLRQLSDQSRRSSTTRSCTALQPELAGWILSKEVQRLPFQELLLRLTKTGQRPQQSKNFVRAAYPLSGSTKGYTSQTAQHVVAQS
jgi:hypothetical protein